MKTLFAVTAALLVGATFAAGQAEAPKPVHPPRMGMMEGPNDPIVRLVRNPAVAKELGLSDEQKAKIDEILKSGRDPELQKELRDSMKRQSELLKAEKIDEAAVMAEIDKAFDIRKEVAKRQTKRVIAIKSTLTPEQVQKALEIVMKRRGPKGARPMPPKAEGEKPAAPKAEGEKPATPPKA